MNLKLVAFLLTFCGLACGGDDAGVEPRTGKLHVGWASRDITPTKPVNLAGQFHIRIATEANNPVTLTALAIETRDGDTALDQAILISCDVVGIPDDLQARLRKLLEGKLPGFDPRKLMLNATHTHSAPDLGGFKYDVPPEAMQPAEYAEFFLARAAEAAIEAWQQRKPGALNFGMDYAVVGYNRRMTYADGAAFMYGNNKIPAFRGVEGYEDHAVETIFFFDADKKLTGVAVNVACPSQFMEGASKIDADFWHDVRVVLRERHSKDLQVLAWCGAAGDQSPHPQMRKAAEARMRGKLSETRAVGIRIADAVDAAYRAIKDQTHSSDVPFVHHVDDLKLPARKIGENEYKNAKALCAQLTPKDGSAPHPNAATRLRWHGKVLERYENAAAHEHYVMELHVLVLGNIAVASNPFELFIDYGIQMKTRSRAIQTFVIQLAGASGGYLPTPRAVAGGGYSAIAESGYVGPDGGQVLVERTVELINSALPVAVPKK